MEDHEYDEVLLSGDLVSIRRASTQSTQRLERFTKLFTMRNLHKFCADVDMFLLESGIEQLGVHYNLEKLSMQEVIEWISRLGLWEAYVRDKELPACSEELYNQTLPILASEEATCDLNDCDYCCTRYNFKSGHS